MLRWQIEIKLPSELDEWLGYLITEKLDVEVEIKNDETCKDLGHSELSKMIIYSIQEPNHAYIQVIHDCLHEIEYPQAVLRSRRGEEAWCLGWFALTSKMRETLKLSKDWSSYRLDTWCTSVSRISVDSYRWSSCALVSQGGQSILEVHICDDSDYQSPFNTIKSWKMFILIGYNQYFHLVHTQSLTVITHRLFNYYFGYIYPHDDYLLLTSDSQVIRIEIDGSIMRETHNIGIDGVIIDHVHDGIIYGRAECDPPDGWRDFQMSLASGEML